MIAQRFVWTTDASGLILTKASRICWFGAATDVAVDLVLSNEHGIEMMTNRKIIFDAKKCFRKMKKPIDLVDKIIAHKIESPD